VQDAGGDADDVQPHVGENVGHLEGVHQVGLAGQAYLPGVNPRGIDIGALDDIQIRIGVVPGDLVEDVVDTDHRNSSKLEAGSRLEGSGI